MYFAVEKKKEKKIYALCIFSIKKIIHTGTVNGKNIVIGAPVI
jgi:hypothetical protein